MDQALRTLTVGMPILYGAGQIAHVSEALAAAFRPGDLLLIFADALTRSWKQVIKFKPEVAAQSAATNGAAAGEPKTRPAAPRPEDPAMAARDAGGFEARGFVRDERGLRFAGEAED